MRKRLGIAGVVVFLGVVGAFWRLDAGPAQPEWAGTDDGKAALLEFQRAEMQRYVRAGADPAEPRLVPADGPPPPLHYPPADSMPPYEVQHYDINLEIMPEDSLAMGSTTISGEVMRDGLDSLIVDYCGPEVFAVEIDGVETDAWQRHGGKLAVALDPPRLFHDDFALKVFHGGVHDRGIYFPRDDQPTTLATHTFSEPEDARWWFPCHDVPNDKATLDMTVTVPADHVVGSNGTLIEEFSVNGRRRFHWREMTPLSTYLMTFQAAPYTILHDDRVLGIPIVHYVYPADSTEALVAFERVPEMIDYFSQLFGPYPFVKYGHTEANFPGGMEHQSLTMVGEFVVTNGETYEWLVAHELTHQWFGDAVTLADWRHIWLNEGFASYGDVLWQEHRFGLEGRAARLRLFSDLFKIGYLQNGFGIPVYDPPAERLFNFAAYDKGAWVLHMLRGIVGDEDFFDILRTYQARHRYGNVVNADFITLCEEFYGGDLDWFFTPWLTDPGLPRYQVTSETTPLGDGRYDLSVSVIQTQLTLAQPGALFPMPVTFALRTQAGETRRSFFVDTSPFAFRDTLEAAPLDTVVVLDPDEWILRTVNYVSLTPVRVTGLAAENGADGSVTLRWRHEDGPRNAQFRVWRENDVPAGANRKPGAGAVTLTPEWLSGRTSYEFLDAAPGPGAAWWVEARDREGAIDWYGPVRATGNPPPAKLAMTAVPGANGAVTLSVTLPRAGHLHIDLFDVSGRRVRMLLDETRAAGRHDIAWDGLNAAGRPINGVFFARAASGGAVATARVPRVR